METSFGVTDAFQDTANHKGHMDREEELVNRKLKNK